MRCTLIASISRLRSVDIFEMSVLFYEPNMEIPRGVTSASSAIFGPSPVRTRLHSLGNMSHGQDGSRRIRSFGFLCSRLHGNVLLSYSSF